MSYALDDFTESLNRVAIKPEAISSVVSAWGSGSGMGTDAGHYKFSEDGATEWSGGFLLKLKDGRYAYVSGWCDYTGWGCQDGATVEYFDTRPSIADMSKEKDGAFGDVPIDGWDEEPSDLNKWLAAQLPEAQS